MVRFQLLQQPCSHFLIRVSQTIADRFPDVFDMDKDVVVILSVKEGESVTLKTDSTIKADEKIQWKFAKSKECGQAVDFEVIAERTKANDGTFLCSNERFRDRLQLDNKTGSLTITNITCVETGQYRLWMPRKKTLKTFIVTVRVSFISSLEAHNVKSHC